MKRGAFFFKPSFGEASERHRRRIRRRGGVARAKPDALQRPLRTGRQASLGAPAAALAAHSRHYRRRGNSPPPVPGCSLPLLTALPSPTMAKSKKRSRPFTAPAAAAAASPAARRRRLADGAGGTAGPASPPSLLSSPDARPSPPPSTPPPPPPPRGRLGAALAVEDMLVEI